MQIIFLTLLLLFCIHLKPVFATDYCKICKKGSHTLCRFKDGNSDKCIAYNKPKLGESVKKYIVDVHNDIRNHIASGQEIKGALGGQPSAANMNILQWDNELAMIAQRWADQCIPLDDDIQHDECRKTERFDVGQNILTAITPNLEVPEIAILILNWYKQVEDVIPSDIESFSGIKRGKYLIGQYTQLVWAETRYVGCGLSTFKNHNDIQDLKYLHRLICNYGPRGNLIGSAVYEKGIPCSKCPFGKCDDVRTNLCEGLNKKSSFSGIYDSNMQTNTSGLHLDIPISLVNSKDLQYLLKHNFSEGFQRILKDVKVHFDSDDIKYLNKKDKVKYFLDLTEILSLLPSVRTKLNQTNLDDEVESNDYYIPYKNSDASVLKNDLTKTVNLLNQDRIFDENYGYKKNYKYLHKDYKLQNGDVIVDNCEILDFSEQKAQRYGYNDGAMQDISESREIILPNNVVLKKVKGIWFHGKCRCNYVYRSAATNTKFKYFTNFIVGLFLVLPLF